MAKRKEVKYCIHHPDVVANETCSVCDKPVCYNCLHIVLGRNFCSTKCFIFYSLKAIARNTLNAIAFLFHILFWPFIQLARHGKKQALHIFFTISILICLFLIIRMNRELRSMQTTILPIDITTEAIVDTTQLPAPRIFEPAEGGMVLNNLITVKGEADENRILSLTVNGELKRVLLPESGVFEFKDVELRRGENTVEIRAITPEGDVTTLQTLSFKYGLPTLKFLGKEMTRGPVDKRQVALTFDGGSIDNIAIEILDILKEAKIKSTFFLTGEFIRKHPKTVKRIVNDGHDVGNHTWSHPKMTSFEENRKHETLETVNEDYLSKELQKTASLFKVVTGAEMSALWRAPYGYYNDEILEWAAKTGYKHIGWTVGRGWEENMDTLDWVKDKDSKAYHTADEIAEKILNYANRKGRGANGAIILMHLGSLREDDFPHQRLPDIIAGLQDKGYALVTISEMAKLQ